MPIKTIKVIYYQGEEPSDMAAEWMTKEDWDRHHAEVIRLKASGEYMKPVEYDISYREEDFDMFKVPSPPPEGYFSNFGILIPKDAITSEQIHRHRAPQQKDTPDNNELASTP